MTARITCIAPNCRRTHRNAEGYAEYLCQKHWALVPKATRKAYKRARRLGINGGKSDAAVQRLWARCVRIAVLEVLQGF